MKRKSVFAAAAVLAAFLLSGCAGSGRAESGEPALVMHPHALRQVVAADNAKGRAILWESEEKEEASVEYREKGKTDIRAAAASAELLKGSQGEPDRYVYEARLTDLSPGTAYEYRTRAGNAASGWHALRTDGGGAFKALLYPDSQSADYGVWKSTFEAGRKAMPDADFFINMGDLVDNGEDEYQWQAWFAAVSPLISEVPVAPLMGNHEAYSLEWKVARPERYLAHFALPENGDASLPEMFWSFDWGPVHFAVLNTQMAELDGFYDGLLAKQQAWLKSDMARTEKKWKVVLMHKDPLQYRIASRPEREEGFSPEGLAFMPLFDELGIDAVISAHLHTYRDRGHIYDLKRDEKGPLYILTGVAGDVRYPNLWTDHALDVYVAPQPETDNFMTLEADEEMLILRAFLPDGTPLDEAVLRK